MRVGEGPLQGVQLAVEVHQLRAQRLDVVVREPLLAQLRQRLAALQCRKSGIRSFVEYSHLCPYTKQDACLQVVPK